MEVKETAITDTVLCTIKSLEYLTVRFYILDLPKAKTTTYGLHSFSYLASKIWNSLPDTYRTSDFLQFKQKILKYEAFPQCKYI